MSGRCWWRGHRWTKWVGTRIRIFGDDGQPQGRVSGQKRYCLRCGKAQMEEL